MLEVRVLKEDIERNERLKADRIKKGHQKITERPAKRPFTPDESQQGHFGTTGYLPLQSVKRVKH